MSPYVFQKLLICADFGVYIVIVDLFLHYQRSYCLECLGAFTKLRKATISSVMSIRLSVSPSVRSEQLGSHWTDFNEI